jgi:hypothetical protein
VTRSVWTTIGRSGLGLLLALTVWLSLQSSWVEPMFDAVAHLFYEVPVLAKLRRPTQLPLVRAHLAVIASLALLVVVASPWLSAHARRWACIFLVGYALRATAWIAGGNLPLVPGDSCHYLEVATSVWRGEGPVKHYVESFFRDYKEIRAGEGVLDDWATPLQAYLLAGAFRALGVEPCRSLEETVGVAKGVSFVLSLLALPVLYAFASRRYDQDIGLGATALLAVLPVHVIYAGFGLRESLVGLTSLLAVWTLTEVWTSSARASWAWALFAGIWAGLAILARNTALALMAGAGLYGLVVHGRRRIAPLLLWGVVLLGVIAPWAWATTRAYGQPFHSYTDYFQYNFSWTVHHYQRGNTRADEFYTAANAPEIVRVKIKEAVIIVVTSTMILSLPLTLAWLRRARTGGDTDRLVATLGVTIVVATLGRVADVTQVQQLGRYYLPLFMLALPSVVAGVRDILDGLDFPPSVHRWLACGLLALLWADPTWAHDASWFQAPYQLHWPALREAGDWIKDHPRDVPENARVMTWFPWELRVASNRTTILFPRNYSASRIDEVIRQYGVTHVLWGSFEPPEHVDPERWGAYLATLRTSSGLTDDREIYSSPRSLPYPVRLFRLR